MKIEINKIIRLANNEEYLVIDKVHMGKIDYYYIAGLNEEKNDITNNYKIVTLININDNLCIDEVLGEDKLKEVLPLFINKY